MHADEAVLDVAEWQTASYDDVDGFVGWDEIRMYDLQDERPYWLTRADVVVVTAVDDDGNPSTIVAGSDGDEEVYVAAGAYAARLHQGRGHTVRHSSPESNPWVAVHCCECSGSSVLSRSSTRP